MTETAQNQVSRSIFLQDDSFQKDQPVNLEMKSKTCT